MTTNDRARAAAEEIALQIDWMEGKHKEWMQEIIARHFAEPTLQDDVIAKAREALDQIAKQHWSEDDEEDYDGFEAASKMRECARAALDRLDAAGE